MQSTKSVIASYMALSTMIAGPYTDITTTEKFGRYERNVPQYARKNEQGRNAKCNCGSGLKYKKCCGK
jgi:uncharacterized protein YecA (UPF0149 family)